MGFLDKLLKRNSEKDHEAWLEKHPGKASTKAPPPSIDPAEQQRMRDQMEGELDSQRAKRDGS